METNQFETLGDFELGLISERQSFYTIETRHAQQGLVVYIPGFGKDVGDYAQSFCQKVASRYQMAAMTVEYFCINARPQSGANVSIFAHQKQKLQAVYQQLGGQGEADFASFERLLEQNGHNFDLHGELVPPNNEYQNFGMMAALDIVNAIKHAVNKYGVNQNNIILVGSSYGGYLANLVTKIHPGWVRGVLDNSSWVYPDLDYALGRESNKHEYVLNMGSRLRILTNVVSPWTRLPGKPNSFNQDRQEIRSFSASQLQAMFDQGGGQTFYVFYHSALDKIAPVQDKIEMAQNMVALGFNHIMLDVVESSDVDGALIKNLDHGMDMSMLRFFELGYNMMQQHQRSFEANLKLESSVYRLTKVDYIFNLNQERAEALIVDRPNVT